MLSCQKLIIQLVFAWDAETPSCSIPETSGESLSVAEDTADLPVQGYPTKPVNAEQENVRKLLMDLGLVQPNQRFISGKTLSGLLFLENRN